MIEPSSPVGDPRLTLINRVLRELPIPLVGSVAYDGAKEGKVCTDKAFAAFADCYSLVRPRRVLEIGTHAGGSALMTLAFTEASVLSVDIGHTWIEPLHSFATWSEHSQEGGLYQVERVLKTHFPGRFGLLVGDSTALGTRLKVRAAHALEPFDLAFIDGDHSYDYVKADIQFARSLGITQMVLDDFNSDNPNSEVAQAAREEGLVVVREWKTIHSGGVSFALTRVA